LNRWFFEPLVFIARRYASAVYAMPMCLSVHYQVLSKSLEMSSCQQRRTIAHTVFFLVLKIMVKFQLIQPNRKRTKNVRLSTNNSLCRKKRYKIGNRKLVRSQMTLSRPVNPNHPCVTFWVFLHISGTTEAICTVSQKRLNFGLHFDIFWQKCYR